MGGDRFRSLGGCVRWCWGRRSWGCWGQGLAAGVRGSWGCRGQGLDAGQLSSTWPPRVSKALVGLTWEVALALPISKGRRVTNAEVASQPLSERPGGSGSWTLYRKRCSLAREKEFPKAHGLGPGTAILWLLNGQPKDSSQIGQAEYPVGRPFTQANNWLPSIIAPFQPACFVGLYKSMTLGAGLNIPFDTPLTQFPEGTFAPGALFPAHQPCRTRGLQTQSKVLHRVSCKGPAGICDLLENNRKALKRWPFSPK